MYSDEKNMITDVITLYSISNEKSKHILNLTIQNYLIIFFYIDIFNTNISDLLKL